MAGGAKFHDSCHSGSGSGYGNMVSELLIKWQGALKRANETMVMAILCGRGRVLKKGWIWILKQ